MKALNYILAAFLCLVTLPTQAAGEVPTLLVPHNQQVSYREHTLCFNVDANVAFTTKCDVDWATVRVSKNNIAYIHLEQNLNDEKRVANITFANEEKGLTQTLVITQGMDGSAEYAPSDKYVKPTSASASSSQSGEGIERSYDRNTSTLYHSNYSGGVSASNPVTLTYNFSGGKHIDYFNYVPRSSGGDNGKFGQVTVSVKHQGETKFTTLGSYDWEMAGDIRTVVLPEDMNEKVTAIQFKVSTGKGGFASCAEMEFFAYDNTSTSELAIFGDELYTTLREGVTQADIDALENPFVKSLATKLFAGTYDKKYRVAEFECFTPVGVLSEEWNAPGKYYDQLAGVTGINFTRGQHAIMVSGIPEGVSVSMSIVAWYIGKVGSNFDGGNPQSFNFALRNGMNVITYDYDWDGLGYICYYANDADNMPNIKVHFINGQVNGYLSPEKSNEEMHELCKNAKNTCMDLYGTRVHSVWTADGLYKYCKASDGTSIGYRQYMNFLDSLIAWEHREIGFEKYGRVPRNRTMAYVNYTYYMFQGGWGVSFHQDQEKRVLNCKTMMYNDYDAVWGLSHEWGHQHQMTPYLCWAGMGEVSNNIFSYYNVHHMGYVYGVGDSARKHFWDHNTSGIPKYSTRRSDIYKTVKSDASKYAFSTDLRNACLAEADSTIYGFDENPTRAAGIYDFDVFEILSPLVMLGNYATITLEKNGKKYEDFYPDLFEALRQEDDVNGGSTIEKQDGFDKYELVAAAQNGNKNGLYSKLAELYPNSCWVKQNYTNKGSASYYDNSVPACLNYIRKASRLYGYNLFDFFERIGFLRVAAYQIGDYGTKNFILTQKMYDEFKADMEQLVTDGVIKALPEQMHYDIFHIRDFNTNSDKMYKTPNIPN